MDETSTLVVIVVCGAIVVAGPCVDRRCAARLVDRAGERHVPVMVFERFTAPWGRFVRTLPSRHNLSAPDTIFGDFVVPVGSR